MARPPAPSPPHPPPKHSPCLLPLLQTEKPLLSAEKKEGKHTLAATYSPKDDAATLSWQLKPAKVGPRLLLLRHPGGGSRRGGLHGAGMAALLPVHACPLPRAPKCVTARTAWPMSPPPPPPDLQLVVSAKAGKGGVKDVTAKLLVTHEFEI